jgi:hypothetical protein
MKVYVAGASAEIDICENYIKRLESSGKIDITFNWCDVIRKNAGIDLISEQLKYLAMCDLGGITEADWLWVIIPTLQSKGCWVELGYAMGTKLHMPKGKRRRIITSGRLTRNDIFPLLADKNCDTHEKAFEFLMIVKDLAGYGL